MYGLGDDIAFLSDELETAKKLLSLVKDELFEKIASSNLPTDKRIELISCLKKLTK